VPFGIDPKQENRAKKFSSTIEPRRIANDQTHEFCDA
jgi:hypothetical protein